MNITLGPILFKCFTHEQVQEINKTITKNIIEKEATSAASANVSKTGEFYIVPCSPLIPLIHRWLYNCQKISKQCFGYHVDWHFHLDSLNYNVYGINNEYGWHIDANKAEAYTDIKLTCLLNLSEEKYEGGEFKSVNTKEENKFNSGMGLVINSLVAHKVTPITKGKRRTLVYFATGPSWR